MPIGMKVVRIMGQEIDSVARRRNELMVGRFRLSLQAQRLFLYVVSLVEDDHDAKTEYAFPVNELARKIGIDRKQLYHDMVRVIKELSEAWVEIEDVNNPGEFTHCGLVQNKVKGTRKSKNGDWLLKGEVRVGLHSELIPYVRAIKKRYTEVELRYAFRLESTYGQKLYDILKSQEFLQREFTFSRDEIYKMLAIEGKFKKFGDFRRFVLERGIKEINTKTDIRVSWKPIKRGRVVEKISFRVQNGKGKEIEFLPQTASNDLFKSLVKCGMPDSEAASIVRAWGASDPERIIWHVQEMQRLSASGKIKKPLAWLRAGIKADYRPQGNLFTVAEKAKEKKLAAEELAREARLRNRKRSNTTGGAKPIGAMLGETIAGLKKSDDRLDAVLATLGEGIAKKAKAGG